MSYEQIIEAIAQGRSVCWSNGYNKVELVDGTYYVFFGMSGIEEPLDNFLGSKSAELFYVEAI